MLTNIKNFSTELVLMLLMFLVLPFLMIPDWVYEYSTQKYLVSTIFISAVFGVLLLKKIRNSLNIKFTISHLFFVAFGISGFLSVISVIINNPDYTRTSFDVALYLMLMVFTAFLITNIFGKNFKWIEIGLFVFTMTGTLVAINGLLNSFYGYDLLLGNIGDPSRRVFIRAFIGNPNFVSDYLATLVPLSVYFVIRQKSNVFVRIYSSANIFIMYWVVLLTRTRSVNFGFLVGIVFFIIVFLLSKKSEETKKFVKSKKFLFWVLIVLIIITFLFVIFNFNNPLNPQGRVSSAAGIASVAEGSAWNQRLLSWESSVKKFLEPEIPMHRYIGSGISTYQVYAITYLGELQYERPQRYIPYWNNFKRTHNDYLQVLGEMGIIGFISLFGLLISMFIIFIKVIRVEREFNKLLLICLYGWSAIIIAIHAFTEFALHMQPNIMICLFIFSTALSEQFVPMKKIEIKKSYLILAPILVLSVISVYLKYNNTMSEVYFKDANYKSSMSDAYQRAVDREIIPALNNHNEELNSLRTQITRHSPGSQGFRTIQSRISEVESEIERLENLRVQYSDESQRFYEESMEDYLTSLDKNPNFGKSAFYLAQLFTKQPYRFRVLSYEDLPDVFNNNRDEYRHIVNEFNGNLRLMPFSNSQIRRTVEELYIETTNENIQNQLMNIQALYDQTNYLESAYISFTEKNSYRLIAKLNFVIFQRYDALKSSLPDIIEIIEQKQNYAYEEFHHWYTKATEILLASWQRFPEWQDVYSEYLTLTINSLAYFDEEEILNRIIPIMKTDGFASYNMALIAHGIPEDSLEVIRRFYLNINEENKAILLNEVITSYADVFEFYSQQKIENTTIYERYSSRIDRFLNAYEFFNQHQ